MSALRSAARVFLIALGFITFSLTLLFFVVSSPPEEVTQPPNTVNDVTQLNEIKVGKIYRPTTIEEISHLVAQHHGTISMGGARHSMGGQIALENSMHLDMTYFNRIVSFSKDEKEITVQSGIRWREIQRHIDPFDLSVKIMQTYADFTVGGSLSVNVHGRYVGTGPLIHFVQSIKVVLPDGKLVNASRTENQEIFRSCIGGYGGFGVIVEATLQLTDNSKVERTAVLMPVSDYLSYFKREIRENNDVVFHNADLYPEEYGTVRAVSYLKTEKPLTIQDRLISTNKSYRAERFAMWMVSEFPNGKWIRQHLGDPLAYASEKVCYRNYEAGYHAMELEPTSRSKSTYVLQEYFVPIDKINSFVPKMASIFQNYDANVINVSIRHAKPDTLSYLSWAKNEVFCFVIYYKQETSTEAKEKVRKWTRELIDAALSEGGSYYLPYQLHATEGQFREAYPRWEESFRVKKKIDPTFKFSNKFWEKYYR